MSEAHYDDRSCARPLFRPAFLFRIAVADPGVCVTGMMAWMTSHGQCPRGGVLVNVSKSGGVFQFFGGRMTSRGQCPRGGGACECLHCAWIGTPQKLYPISPTGMGQWCNMREGGGGAGKNP